MTESETTDRDDRREFLRKIGLGGAKVAGAAVGGPLLGKPDMTTTGEGLDAAGAGPQAEGGLEGSPTVGRN